MTGQEGPFIQSRGSDGRFGPRSEHHCEQSDTLSAALGGAAIGALAVAAGVAAYRWFMGEASNESEEEQAESTNQRRDVRLEANARINALEASAKTSRDLVATSVTAEDAAEHFQSLADDLRELTAMTRAYSAEGIRVSFDPTLWGWLMTTKRETRKACLALRQGLAAFDQKKLPVYRYHSIDEDRTSAIISRVYEQVQQASELATWVARRSRDEQVNPRVHLP